VNTVEWKGTPYPVPPFELPQSRDPAGLHPIFSTAPTLFMGFAQPHLPDGFELRVGECRRTMERQTWLYAQGRVNGEHVRSWTMDSKHRYGLAADLIIVNLGADLTSSADDTADWSQLLWRAMYAAVPPEMFGLTTIPQELVHIEAQAADLLIARSTALGVTFT
jgi:hypothetical protein